MSRDEPSTTGTGGELPGRLRAELRKYLLVSAYLYVCFGAIELFKTAVLRDAGIAFLPLGFAAAKALILGKLLLLGEAVGVGMRAPARTLLQRIALRVILLLAALVVLVAVEELLAGWIHGRPAAETLGGYGQRLPELLATVLLLLLILVPLVTVVEFGRVLGSEGLRGILLAPPRPTSATDRNAASPRTGGDRMPGGARTSADRLHAIGPEPPGQGRRGQTKHPSRRRR